MSYKNPASLLATSRYVFKILSFSTTMKMAKELRIIGWASRYSTTTTTTTATNTSDTNKNINRRFRLLVIGGGSGGSAVAARMAHEFQKYPSSKVAVIEPSTIHYYQPLWTLVGAGLKPFEASTKPTKEVLHKDVVWIKDKAVNIDPDSQKVKIGTGQEIEYDYLVVATGIQLHYDRIKGLQAALTKPGVCSNYSPAYVQKTYTSLQAFERGNAVFTFPNTPIKCAGAPQKIAYLTDAHLRKTNKRKDAKLIYCTSLPNIFGVKKYADALWDVAKKKDIEVHLRHNLVEVLWREKKAVFENLDNPSETKIIPYDLLHVTPPMGPPDLLKNATNDLVDSAGYLNVNKETLQHVNHPNIFGLGDCTNLPCSKTAAACAAQFGVLWHNLWDYMRDKDMKHKYDGYSSCPLTTSDKHVILAEFDYNLQPLETFPFNQAKESRLMFILKKNFLPSVYWHLGVNGFWEGPGWTREKIRKIPFFGHKKD